MPIRPENRKFYGWHWRRHVRPPALVAIGADPKTSIGKCQACWKIKKLDVAHRDRVAGHDDPSNLVCLCKPCHNRYDAAVRERKSRRTRIRRKDAARPILALIQGEVDARA